MGKIITVCGEITSEELGYTSMHDHTIYDYDYVTQGFAKMRPDLVKNIDAYKGGADVLIEAGRRKAMRIEMPQQKARKGALPMSLSAENPASRISDVEYYTNELKQFRLLGGQSLCDDSVVDFFKPKLSEMQEISKRSGVNIISSAGFYANATISDTWLKQGERAMTEYLEDTIIEGDKGCGARPGFIKCATNTLKDGDLAPKEVLALRVCTQAAKKYGMSLHIHTTSSLRDATILKIADILENKYYMDPSRVVFCHLETDCLGFFSQSAKINVDGYDIKLPVELIKRGFNIGIDTWGMNSDDENIFLYTVELRKKLLSVLVDLGYAGNITLGHDMMRKTLGVQNRGGGYTVFPWALRQMVMDGQIREKDVQKITVENPARILQIR